MTTKNNATELVFILDRSGSMGGLEQDTIGGFNAMIEKQKKQEGDCLVSTVLFDHESLVLHDRIPLEKVPVMTEKDYEVRGSTALIDALGDAVKHVAMVHRYIRAEDVPANVLFVITTDGYENASHRYTSDEVKKMIQEKKEKGWEFLFIGANIDAVETAAHYGIGADRAVNYHADGQGTAVLYDSVNEAIHTMRCAAPLKADWDKKIRKDYSTRKKKQ